MKKDLLLLCFCLIATFSYSQNCGAPSTGFTPINDLGLETFNGSTGGLYPGGSNFIPTNHKLAGLQMASQIQCLDTNGKADPINGKIVWLSIGLSNTTLETQQFIPIANSFTGKNPKLSLVDGAVGAMSASYISTPSNINYATYWNTVAMRLKNAGVTANQVEVIWLKEANPAGTVPVKEYYDSLVVQYKRIMHEVKNRFPNVKICYFSSRISARYATSTLNPEPHAYYTGWAIKKVIEDQINGDVQLQFTGATPNSPWMAWGSYMWSDGSNPQKTNPNVFWTCSTDFNTSDGTHPSTIGAIKVANLWLTFLSTDSTSTPWFMGAGCNTSTGKIETNSNKAIKVYPNPSRGDFTIQLHERHIGELKIVIYNSLGEKIFNETRVITSAHQNIQIHLLNLTEGTYFIQLIQGDEQIREKIIISN
ncbi:MAG: T9SS type A sorting domain-containing protein [bacterium]|nr:T9SS type A sorting domain-containing protein [bacterium]